MSDLNNGMYLPKNDASSTAGYEFHPFSANVQGQNNENSTAKIFPPEYYQLLTQQIYSLQQEVASLKKSAETSQTFFKQSVLLQRVCLVIIVLLPIILAGLVATIAYVFCSNEQMILYAKWILGILGFGSIVDLFVIFATHSIDQKRFEHIERRLDHLEK